ncbi:hypothetical protein K3495_g301 [Podosphaera aphanis]|nr:hypothetical protein K3495_g301 [Podosphaera aphanis]
MDNMSTQTQWIILAIASGACAAFNGVFAKLTTTVLTSQWATVVATSLRLEKGQYGVEVVIRAIFFGLNLLFNGIMWALFTKALTRGTSTVQVSILNTSSNFLITAVLGCMIFSERLPPMWFAGAALLVAGNVIIGRRDEPKEALSPNSANSGREDSHVTDELELDRQFHDEAEGNCSETITREPEESDDLIQI